MAEQPHKLYNRLITLNLMATHGKKSRLALLGRGVAFSANGFCKDRESSDHLAGLAGRSRRGASLNEEQMAELTARVSARSPKGRDAEGGSVDGQGRGPEQSEGRRPYSSSEPSSSSAPSCKVSLSASA